MEHNYQIHEIANMDVGLLHSETPSGVTTTVFHVWDGNCAVVYKALLATGQFAVGNYTYKVI